MPDSLYELVEENAHFVVQERTETALIHRNSKGRGIPGDINTALRHLGFSGIYWTTSYGFKCDQNSGECPLCGKVSHFSNNFRVNEHEPTGDWYVANFSRECRSTKFIQGKHRRTMFFPVLNQMHLASLGFLRVKKNQVENRPCRIPIHFHAIPSQNL